MVEFITNGGVFMVPILLFGLAIAVISLERINALYMRKDRTAEAAQRRLPALKYLGVGCTLVGALGTLVGIYQAFSSPRLLAEGMPIYDVVRIASTTSIMGMTISCVALLAYGVFRVRARKIEERVAGIS
jgi:biopolymer transport protein ExbB/TolQ